MKSLRKQVTMKLETYQNLIQQILKEQKMEPEGHLRVSKFKTSIRYYQVKENKKDSYLSRYDMDLARALAQKGYRYSILSFLQTSVTQMKKFLKETRDYDIEDRYIALSDYRKELVTPYVEPINTFIEKWENVPYSKKGFENFPTEIYTERGERVRSKSEKILADKFLLMGIPYRYEYPLELQGYGLIHPDFMLLNKRTREEFFWEHLGMMDNAEYSEKNMTRLDAYERNGFLLGKNLIISTESQQRILSSKLVEKKINTFLL